jgi:hypothetical protein
MGYDTKKLFEQAIKIIDDKEPVFIEDLISYLPCSKPTFYDHFKVDSDEFNEIKEKLEAIRIGMKSKMRSKWFNSDNPTLQLALMKLIGTDQEAHRLNGSIQKIDHSSKDGSMKPQINLSYNGKEISLKDD